MSRDLSKRDPTPFEVVMVIVFLLAAAILLVCGLWYVWTRPDVTMLGKTAFTALCAGAVAFVAIRASGE